MKSAPAMRACTTAHQQGINTSQPKAASQPPRGATGPRKNQQPAIPPQVVADIA